MKIILLFTFFFPSLIWAHCPSEININNETYCVNIDWIPGEKKLKGQYSEASQMSPYLIPMKEVPQKWVYSQAQINIWKVGDKTHSPVVLKDFRVFPYMHMISGHHHSAGYDFFYDDNSQTYIIRQLAFQSMKGCWSLRWTTETKDEFTHSNFLSAVTDYSNIDKKESEQQESYCMNLDLEPNSDTHHSH